MSRDKQPIIDCITPVGKLNYVYLAEPQEDEKGVGWYKVTIAWPKAYRDTQLKDFRQKCTQAAKQFFGNDVPKLQPILRDGDNIEHNSADVEEFHGKYYITAKVKAEKGRPGCVDAKGNEISYLDVYSGCTARISIILGGYSNLGKKGVWIRLQNIQKAEDGERIGGKPSAKKQFGALDGFADDDEDDLL